MKKIILTLIIVFISTATYSQTKAELAGMWKIMTQVSMGKKDPAPTYFSLNADGTYLWPVDSASGNPLKDVSKDMWDVTSDGDIKLMPTEPNDRARYYAKRGDMYE